MRIHQSTYIDTDAATAPDENPRNSAGFLPSGCITGVRFVHSMHETSDTDAEKGTWTNGFGTIICKTIKAHA
jgi:hypothetical protein